jgi:ABC-type transport system involved in multi-copper enzyme maturation permease subunit
MAHSKRLDHMLKNIIKKEIHEILISPKFVLTIVLCTLLVLLSVFTGVSAYRADQEEYQAAISLNKKNVESASSYASLLMNGIKINRPPNVLSSIVKGVSEAVGQAATITDTNDPSLADSKFENSPILSLNGTLDLTFIVKIVLSLLAIVFTYDIIVGEKERGTLKLIISNGIPRDSLLIGKALGGYISLAIAFIFPLLLGLFILLINPRITLSNQDWMRFFLIFFSYFLYLSVFFTLGLFISTISSKTSTSFLFLLFIWVIFVMIIPKASILIAAQIQPIPSVHEITAKKTAYLQQVQDGILKRNQEWGKEHSPKTPEEQKRYQEDFKASLEENQRWAASQLEKYYSELEKDFRYRKRSQERLALNLSRLSPASALMYSTMSLARTGLDEYDRYLESIRAYKSILMNWVIDQDMKNFKFSGTRPKMSLENMPSHAYKPESLSKSFARSLFDIALMFTLIIIFFLGAYLSFRKYDVR